MNRRAYLGLCGIAASGAIALAGCSSAEAAPPRKSNVVSAVRLEDLSLVIDVASDEDQWVLSRRDVDLDRGGDSGSVGSSSDGEASGFESSGDWLSGPVGTARAAKGRGATGRGRGGYADAPRTHNGRAWFWGGSYTGDWYDDHDDETVRLPVDVATLGIAYLGSNQQFQEQDPGPGPVDWDEEYEDPVGVIRTDAGGLENGWYRVGTRTRIEGSAVDGSTDRDLGWECIDLRVEFTSEGHTITERWKVSPRI